MPFVRVMVIDPSPVDPSHDTLVYQIPVPGRHYDFFISLLDTAEVEHVTIGETEFSKKKAATKRRTKR